MRLGFSIKQIKNFLESNKVFFETITATFLSVMAIFVTINSNIISDKQVELLKRQVDIENRMALPRFLVKRIDIYNKQEDKYADDNIYIYNKGEASNHVNVDYLTFADVIYVNDGVRKDISFPILGYYFVGLYENAVSDDGLICKIVGNRNNEKFLRLQSDFSNLVKKTDDKNVGIIDLRRYVRLRYQDIFGVDRVVYYSVPIISSGKIMEPSDGENVFSEYASQFSSEYELDTLTAESLLEIINRFVK